MFTTIKKMAEIDSYTSESSIEDFIEFPKTAKCVNAYFLNIKEKNNKFNYTGLDVKELDITDNRLYLFPKNRHSRGVLKTPTVQSTSYDQGDSSYKGRVYKWFEKNKKRNPIFLKCLEALKENEKKIKEDILTINDKIYFLSLKINENYLGELPEFVSLLSSEDAIKKKFSEKHGKKAVLKKATCSICFKNDLEVYGFAIPYSFFTVDSPGFSYGFNQENAVKQVPICMECAKKINGSGIDYLEKQLSFKLCNVEYFLIPEFISTSNENTLKINKISERFKQAREEIKTVPNKERLRQSSKIEERIIRSFSKEDYLILNFFFYKKDQNKFNILASVEEVLPSSLSKFYKALESTVNTFQKLGINNGKNGEVYYNYYLLSDFLENKKVDFSRRSKKEFLEVLNKIFTLRPLSYEYILNKAMINLKENATGLISNDKKKSGSFWAYTRNSFLLFNIFCNPNISLIEIKETRASMNSLQTQTNYLDSYCNNFEHFFAGSALRKAIFGFGVLTEMMAGLQSLYYNNKDSKPIYKHLKNFNLDQRDILRLSKKLKEGFIKYKKAKQTKKFPFKKANDLFEEVSLLLANSGLNEDSCDISSNELSYFFILGMNLHWNFRNNVFGETPSENEPQPVE